MFRLRSSRCLPPRLAPAMLASLPLIALAGPLSAACGTDPAAITLASERLAENFAIASDIDCQAAVAPGQKILCENRLSGDGQLWAMSRLADMSWAYAWSNATGIEISLNDPPRSADYIARRDACSDETCLCAAMTEQTNDALGGLSPYGG